MFPPEIRQDRGKEMSSPENWPGSYSRVLRLSNGRWPQTTANRHLFGMCLRQIDANSCLTPTLRRFKASIQSMADGYCYQAFALIFRLLSIQFIYERFIRQLTLQAPGHSPNQ